MGEQTQQEGLPDEGQFMAFIRVQYSAASYEQPPVHDFEKFVRTFASFPSPAAGETDAGN